MYWGGRETNGVGLFLFLFRPYAPLNVQITSMPAKRRRSSAASQPTPSHPQSKRRKPSGSAKTSGSKGKSKTTKPRPPAARAPTTPPRRKSSRKRVPSARAPPFPTAPAATAADLLPEVVDAAPPAPAERPSTPRRSPRHHSSSSPVSPATPAPAATPSPRRSPRLGGYAAADSDFDKAAQSYGGDPFFWSLLWIAACAYEKTRKDAADQRRDDNPGICENCRESTDIFHVTCPECASDFCFQCRQEVFGVKCCGSAADDETECMEDEAV